MTTLEPATFVDGRFVLGRIEIRPQRFVANAAVARDGSAV